MRISTKIKQAIMIQLAMLVVVIAVATTATLPAYAATTALQPGEGRIKLVCDPGRVYQSIVVTADVQGLPTSGVTFVAGNVTKTRAYGTGIVQAKFTQTNRGNVTVYAEYLTSDTALHTITFQGKNIVTVPVTTCP